MMLNLVLICISFDMNEVKHFFICLRVSCISFLFILAFCSLGFLISSLRALLFAMGVANTLPSICQLSFNFADGGFYHSNNFYDQVVKFVYLLLSLLNYKVILCCKVL